MTKPSSTPVRIAVVGCGAVARESLLPVLAGHDGVTLGPLVDRDERRARELADAYAVPSVLTDMNALSKDIVDAVILATPPGHHAPATIALANKGLHVLVEKPMAIAAADAEAMVKAADANKIALSVGLYRRFLPSVQLLKSLIDRGEFGRVLSVDAEEGGPYGWPLATLDVLKRSTGGGGTLIDLGSHVIDVILYVTSSVPTLERYEDNERGGIETDCVLRASLQTGSDTVPFRLELSRTRELRGTIQITCEEAVLELPRASFTEVIVRRKRASATTTAVAPIEFKASWPGVSTFLGYEAFRREIDDWLHAIATGHDAVLSGRSVVPMVRLIENAYNARTPLVAPVEDLSCTLPVTHGTKKRVLVTGAGGFLGGRTVELLRDHFGYDVAPMVREPKGAARLARWPYDVLLGDVCSRDDMDRAVKGCDAVVHCAVGTSWKPEESRRVTVDGTRTAAEASLAAGVSRFVHISTLFVHERSGAGTIDEQTPLNPPQRDDYGLAKLAAEQALDAVTAKGLSSITIRPTRIYGPYSRTFTLRPLQALAEGRLAIGGNPDVPANMVYVDNVVAAIAKAIEAPNSLKGSAFIVTDEDQLTLREFYEWFGKNDGFTVTVLPDWQPEGGGPQPGAIGRFVNGVRTILTSGEFRGIVRKVFDTDPIGTVPRRFWDRNPKLQQQMLRRFGSSPAVVYRPEAGGNNLLIYDGEAARASGARASKELGLVQARTREEAMALTLEWARYARLLPQDGPR